MRATVTESTPRRPVFERTLDNGLKLLLREDHDAPLASIWTWYRVGARNEIPGRTGLSHWVEHMQFKGTPTLAKGQIFRDVSRHGGVLNALTSNDWTAYFETIPAERLDLMLAIESDRMANSLFDPDETESERTVILSERQGAENNPTFLLYEEVVGTAFRSHPYRHMVVGHEADLRAISRDDLFSHYQTYYRPNNAFIAAAGDFDAEDLATRIEQSFGALESNYLPPSTVPTEPPQRGERRVILRRPAPTTYLRMGFHTPAASHPDTAAILVADAVLSGGKGMGLGGGGMMGRSSRLYTALVAAGLARAAGSDFDLFVDPYLLIIGVTAIPGVEPERIESIVATELARLRDQLVPDDELRRALKQVKAQYVYSAEGVTNQAFWLGQMELLGDWRRADTFVEELEAVTPADLQRVAQTYLVPDQCTVGWLLPSGEGGGLAGEKGEPAAVKPRWYFAPPAGSRFGGAGASANRATGATTASSRPPFERRQLTNGLVVLGQARPNDPTIYVRMRVEAGAIADPVDRLGLAAFTARMLTRGAGDRSFDQINEATDDLGAAISVGADRRWSELSVRCLREDLPAMLDLAADVLRRPTFPAEQIDKIRNELQAAIREADNDTRATADRVLRRLLYPEPHPLGRRPGGELESVAGIGRDDLVAFHRDQYGPRVTTVAIVGGVASFDEAIAQIEQRFGDWDGAATTAAANEPAPRAERQVRQQVSIDGKSQADIAIGFPTLPRTDPRYYAFDTANLVLGQLGLMGRFGANVRDAQGLAYYAYSQVEPDRDESIWFGRAGVDPSNVERAIESMIAEAQHLREAPVDADELADAKSYLTGVLPLALESNDGVAATLLAIERYGLGLDYLDRYPALIGALTGDDLLAAVRDHLDPDRLAVAVAGPPAAD